MITQSINLNLIPGAVPPRIKISQYDQGSRTLVFTLYNGTAAFTTSGCAAKIQGTKPDNKGFAYDATYSNGIVTADLELQMSCVPGDVICEIVLTKDEEVLATGNFVLDVEASALADDIDVSDTVLPAYIDAAEAAAREAAESAATATDAKNAAVDAKDTAVSAKNTAVSAKDDAVAAAAIATAAELNPPYIGANGNWYVYDTSTSQYVDSHIDASITVSIADVTMLDPGATPYVTNTGTDTDPIFHLFVPRGQTGAQGLGLPAGGTVRQILVKKSATDYDTEWASAAGGDAYWTVSGTKATFHAVYYHWAVTGTKATFMSTPA